MTSVPVRGQIYRADIGFGAKPWLIISNNHRNRVLNSVLAVRVTTTAKHINLPTWVPLSSADPMVGAVNCDDLEQLEHRELSTLLGTLTPTTLLKINDALKLALALP